MLTLAKDYGRYPLLAYINADIMLCDDFTRAVQSYAARGRGKQVLLFGRRTNVDISGRLSFGNGWQKDLQDLGRETGYRSPGGADYFVFSRNLYPDIPAFALGRGAWDIWMIHAALAAGADVLDASAIVQAWHQNHDYDHLPGEVQANHPRGRRDWTSKGVETVYNEALFADPSWLTPYHDLVQVLGNS
jgi:hypothetical protein